MTEQARSKTIDLGDLTEVVLNAVSRAMEERPAGKEAHFLPFQRIICGIIVDPQDPGGAVKGERT